ncbi:MAG: hypothetical protein VX341_04085 [Bdellovibrionota bacterium]|nr:hypothetical protein [Bdellovibrionota bacterium]
MKALGNDLLKQLEDLLEESLSPIEVAYFESVDKYLNLKCRYSNITQYESNTIYNPYRIKPILRVLLLKSEVIDETSISEIFLKDKKEICLVLEYKTKKSFFILNLEDAKYIKDMKLIKTLEKNTKKIESIFSNNFKNEEE